jgi:hypothetical protein
MHLPLNNASETKFSARWGCCTTASRSMNADITPEGGLLRRFRLSNMSATRASAPFFKSAMSGASVRCARSRRALQRTVDYIDRAMPDAAGFEAPAEVLTIAPR